MIYSRLSWLDLAINFELFYGHIAIVFIVNTKAIEYVRVVAIATYMFIFTNIVQADQSKVYKNIMTYLNPCLTLMYYILVVKFIISRDVIS